MDDAALALVRELLATHGPALELYARCWCDTPEDVVQEALVRLLRERPLPERPVAWMYRAVRRRALTAARSAQRRRQHELAAGSASNWFEASVEDALDAQTAAAALVRLPGDEREVIVLRLWGGMSFEEVGDLVGCSASAAHRRYGAALASLRKELGELCPHPTRSRETSKNSPPR